MTKLAFLHVYKLHPETTVNELTRSIEPIFPGVVCEQIKSRFPQYYSSFKVTISESNLPTAWNPDVWPKGVLVNWFFRPKKPKITEK